jgi:ABC-type transporter Mla subunit MlaD
MASITENKPEERLHERISRNLHSANDFTHHLESRVESLKSAISLNKKIAFVNDLFKENTVEYAKAIEKLNTASDKNDALRYFSELKHTYSWDNNDELVKDLENLITKRYS